MTDLDSGPDKFERFIRESESGAKRLNWRIFLVMLIAGVCVLAVDVLSTDAQQKAALLHDLTVNFASGMITGAIIFWAVDVMLITRAQADKRKNEVFRWIYLNQHVPRHSKQVARFIEQVNRSMAVITRTCLQTQLN